MVHDDIPPLRSRDYPLGSKGCDPHLRLLLRNLDDLQAIQHDCLRSLTTLRGEVRQVHRALQVLVAAIQQEARAPGSEMPRAPSQNQGEPRRLRSAPAKVTDARSARTTTEQDVDDTSRSP